MFVVFMFLAIIALACVAAAGLIATADNVSGTVEDTQKALAEAPAEALEHAA